MAFKDLYANFDFSKPVKPSALQLELMGAFGNPNFARSGDGLAVRLQGMFDELLEERQLFLEEAKRIRVTYLPAAAAGAIGAMVPRLRQKALDLQKYLDEVAKPELAEYEAKLVIKPASDPAGAVQASEIRQRLLKKGDGDRLTVFLVACENSNEAVLSAMLNDPLGETMRGIAPEIVKQSMDAYYEAHSPGRAARIEQVKRAIRVTQDGINVVKKLTDTATAEDRAQQR